jgi:thioredoxin reductase
VPVKFKSLQHRPVDVAIIGAGPYGMSLAAHLRARGVRLRIFGKPMRGWSMQMPKGMLLKSDGFATNLSDPDGAFTLKRFCAEKGIEYADTGIPVRLDTFIAYGLAFQQRMAPDLEDKTVVGLDRSPEGFVLRLDDGEMVAARRAVLATGIGHFGHMPAPLAHLPPAFASHSSRHRDPGAFRHRSVAVIGGGASATDLAGLLHEAGARVQLIARQSFLKFHGKPENKRRSLLQQIRHPPSGLGPGWRSRFYTEAPILFHCFPERLRLEIVRRHLGPAGGWFAREKVMGQVPLLLGYALEHAEIRDGMVRLRIRAADGTMREVMVEHVIAATGYKVDIARLPFLGAGILSRLRTVEVAPVLTTNFESSIPGLHFIGAAAANSFGPMMRFVFGAGFTARHLTRTLARQVPA